MQVNRVDTEALKLRTEFVGLLSLTLRDPHEFGLVSETRDGKP